MANSYTSFEYLSLIEPLSVKIELAIFDFKKKLSSGSAKNQEYINNLKTKLDKINTAYNNAKSAVSESTWSLIKTLKDINPLTYVYSAFDSAYDLVLNTYKNTYDLINAEGTYKALKSIEIQINNLAVEYEKITGEKSPQSTKIIDVKDLTGETYLDKIKLIAKWGVIGIGIYYGGKILLELFEKPYPNYAKRIK